jgi:hypothetical protein
MDNVNKVYIYFHAMHYPCTHPLHLGDIYMDSANGISIKNIWDEMQEVIF